MQVTDSHGDSTRLLKHGGDAHPLRSLGRPTEGHDMIHMLKRHTSDWYRTNASSDADRCASSFSWFHVRVRMTAGLGFFTDAYDILVLAINFDHEMMLLSGGIALGFLIVATIAGSNLAMISDGVLVIWSTAIAYKFALTSCDRVMPTVPTVFTPQGREDLANSLTALVGRLLGRARGIGNGGESRRERRKRARRRPGALR